MTREDIIRMAREAELEDSWLGWCQECGCDGEKLARFAALVYEQGFLAGMKNEEQITIETVAAERERNAQIADAHASIEGIAQRIAAEIRGQG